MSGDSAGCRSMSNPASATPKAPSTHQSFWLWVMCLTGVDYFSTLGYQPSIAYQNAGMLAPLATVVLVFVTLFGALPIYAYVARKSHTGLGSIGMLAKFVSGWFGKLLVLILLGFAAHPGFPWNATMYPRLSAKELAFVRRHTQGQLLFSSTQSLES